jgi:ABC-type glycerol-3-phosphate transport system substrate-binding protein
MSMYKKSIALILGVCLLASAALTGCSSAKSSSSTTASGSTAPVTIQVYSWEASLQVQNDCVV